MFDLEEFFRGRGAQLRVARHMIRSGIGVNPDGALAVDGVEVKQSSLADELGVDRRVVKSTVESILEDDYLKSVFSKLKSTVFLRDAAPELGFGVFEVVPTDAAAKGIVSGVTGVLARHGIGIRQVVADDPMFENAELTVITEKPIDKQLLNELLEVEGVDRIMILN